MSDKQDYVEIISPNVRAKASDRIEAVFKDGRGPVVVRRILHDFARFRYPRISIRGDTGEGPELRLARLTSFHRDYSGESKENLIEGNPHMHFELAFKSSPAYKSLYEVRYESGGNRVGSAMELLVKTINRPEEGEKWVLTRELRFVGVVATVWAYETVLARRALNHLFEDSETSSTFLLQEKGREYSLTHTTPSRSLLVSFPQEIDLAYWISKMEIPGREWEKLLREVPLKATVITPLALTNQ